MLHNYLQQTTSADVIFQMQFFLALKGLKLMASIWFYFPLQILSPNYLDVFFFIVVVSATETLTFKATFAFLFIFLTLYQGSTLTF